MKLFKRSWTLASSTPFLLWSTLRDLKERLSSRAYLVSSSHYPPFMRAGNAASFCREHALQFCKGRGLDIGASKWPFEGARAIDQGSNENALTISEPENSIDFVFSSHCLEHIREWKSALTEWIRVLRPGGILYLYLPHPACEMWEVGVNPFHEWTPTPHVIKEALTERGMEIAEISYFPDSYLSFYVVAKKREALSCT